MEAFYYREIFERFYPLRATTVKKWIPKTEWEGVGDDPSGIINLLTITNSKYKYQNAKPVQIK